MSGQVSRDLAGWVAALRYEDIPAEVLHHLKYCLLDGFGCGLFGATQPWGKITSKTACEMAGDGHAALFAGGGCASPAEAALANGTAVHGFEIDDVHVASSLHPGAVVIPAVLAAMTGKSVSGRDMLTALAAGYESGLRVGVAAGVRHSTSGYHVTASVGTVAAGMATARLLGLGPEATLNALGIAATQACGLYSARKNAMTKRLHAGIAARAGVTGAFLARRGFTGAAEVLEAPFGGFFSTLNGEHAPETALDGIGDRWETERVGFKAYASCASSHTTVDALDDLMEQGLTADLLDTLDLSLSRKGAINVGWDYVPGTVVSAQMNAQYVAAVKLLEGEVFIRQFREDLLDDGRILDLVSRISVRHDPQIDALGAALRHTVRAVARTTDGRTLEVVVNQRKGSAERPLLPIEIATKFRKVAAAAAWVEVAKLEETILSLDDVPDAATDIQQTLIAGGAQGPR